MTVQNQVLTPLIDAFLTLHPADAGRVIESQDLDSAAAMLATRPVQTVASTLMGLGVTDAARIFSGFEPDFASRVLTALDPVQAARLLSNVEDERQKSTLDSLDEAQAGEIREILSYPPATAGRSMDARVFTAFVDATVGEVLAGVRRAANRSADLPVVDRNGVFRGLVSLHELVAEPPERAIASLMHVETVSVVAMAPHEEVVDLLNLHKLRNLPVVDADGRLVGMLRHDALVKAARSEAAADMQQMVGANARERALSTPWVAVRSRLPWLQINLLTAFLASAVVGYFEDTIARITALAVLLPVAAGQSGNTGAQALAVTMRGLALREIRVSHIWRVLRKEALTGMITGVSVGVTSGLGVYLWSGNFALASLMGVAMVCSMVVASISGAAIPAILTVLGRDPATAASIVLTTVTDVVGFITFLGLAQIFANALQG